MPRIKKRNFKPEIGVKDDPLLFVYNITLMKQVDSSRLLQIILLCPTAYYFIMVPFGFYKMYMNDWKAVIRRYGPNLFILGQSVVISLVLWLFRGLFMSHPRLIHNHGLSLKSAGEESFLEIKKECRTIKIFSLGIMLVTFCCSVSEFAFVGDEEEWQFALCFIRKHLSGWQYKLMFIMNESVCITFGYIMVVPIFLTIYIINQIKYQFRILNKYWEGIKEDEGCLHDIEYQKRIYRQLKRCVDLHIHILRISNLIMKNFAVMTVGLLICALISFVAPAYFILSNVSPPSNFRMYFIIISCFIQEILACAYCQHMTDESYNVYLNAVQCPWTDWDQRNQKTFLIILTNITNPVQTSRHGVPNANYELILRIWRMCYALLTLLYNVSAHVLNK